MTCSEHSSQCTICSPTAHDLASLTTSEAMEQLVTSTGGLTTAEATARLLRFGRNTLPRIRRTAWWLSLASNFAHLFAVLLWIAALLAWLAGMPQLTLAIAVVVIVNGVFRYWQQYRAEQAVEALESLLPRRTTVRREGNETIVDVPEVAVGDVLLPGEGEDSLQDEQENSLANASGFCC